MAGASPRKIFLIAAEESGDRLGAALMKALRVQLGGDATFTGIGGRHPLADDQACVPLSHCRSSVWLRSLENCR